jgi:uncharacterized HAD superfamily protein
VLVDAAKARARGMVVVERREANGTLTALGTREADIEQLGSTARRRQSNISQSLRITLTPQYVVAAKFHELHMLLLNKLHGQYIQHVAAARDYRPNAKVGIP